MRANPKLPAGCPGLFGLERLHLFNYEHAWKSFGAVKLMTGSERWGYLYIRCAHWLKRYTEWWVLTIDLFKNSGTVLILFFYSLYCHQLANCQQHKSFGFGYHVTLQNWRMPCMHSKTIGFNYLGTRVRSFPPGKVPAFLWTRLMVYCQKQQPVSTSLLISTMVQYHREYKKTKEYHNCFVVYECFSMPDFMSAQNTFNDFSLMIYHLKSTLKGFSFLLCVPLFPFL